MKKVVVPLILAALGLAIFSFFRLAEKIETVLPENGWEFVSCACVDGYTTLFMDQSLAVDLSDDDLARGYVSPELPEYVRFIRLYNNQIFITYAGLHPGH